MLLASSDTALLPILVHGRIEKVHGMAFEALMLMKRPTCFLDIAAGEKWRWCGQVSVSQDIFQIAAASWLPGNAIDWLSGCAFAAFEICACPCKSVSQECPAV